MSDDGTSSLFGDLIHSYSRAQALADGELVDVSVAAAEVGIRFPVALIAAVHALIVPSGYSATLGQSERGRLHDVVWMLRCAILAARGRSETTFVVAFADGDGQGHVTSREVSLRCVCGPGDDAEPVLTVMMLDER